MDLQAIVILALLLTVSAAMTRALRPLIRRAGRFSPIIYILPFWLSAIGLFVWVFSDIIAEGDRIEMGTVERQGLAMIAVAVCIVYYKTRDIVLSVAIAPAPLFAPVLLVGSLSISALRKINDRLRTIT